MTLLKYLEHMPYYIIQHSLTQNSFGNHTFYNLLIPFVFDYQGKIAVQGIVLNLPKLIKTAWNPKSFLMMQHLKLLIINNVHLMHDLKHLSNHLRYLDWRGYSSKSLPSSFQSNELIELLNDFGKEQRYLINYKQPFFQVSLNCKVW